MDFSLNKELESTIGNYDRYISFLEELCKMYFDIYYILENEYSNILPDAIYLSRVKELLLVRFKYEEEYISIWKNEKKDIYNNSKLDEIVKFNYEFLKKKFLDFK